MKKRRKDTQKKTRKQEELREEGERKKRMKVKDQEEGGEWKEGRTQGSKEIEEPFSKNKKEEVEGKEGRS